MDSLQNLLLGLGVALLPQNLLYAFLGCTLGTFIGVMPGIGPTAGTAILLPLTFQLDATGAIIMLAAIYYGAMYGGTITSVLMNVPGEPASAVTCIDGYQMARKGRAGVALSIAAIGSFLGGTLAVVGLVVAAPPLASVALRFGPPEMFALMALGISLVMGLAGKSVITGLVSGVFGLALSLPGTDLFQGTARMTFGQRDLLEGLSFVPVVMGLFGVGEILFNLERESVRIFDARMSSLIPSARDVRDSVGPIGRSTLIGFFLGLIPGIGAIIPTFAAYILEKKLSRYPEKFGTGVIEGVAAPETANNAYANAALIPLFTLGIPGSPTIAILMGAFMMNGLSPGPFLFKEHPAFVWAVIASLYVGNVILLILNLPLIRMWVTVLKIPYSVLFPLILAFTVIGSYSLNHAEFDVGVLIGFGVLGYLFKKMDFPLAPMTLTLILGPLMEKALRQSLTMSMGDLSILLRSPISTVLLALAVLSLLSSGLRSLPISAVRGQDSQL